MVKFSVRKLIKASNLHEGVIKFSTSESINHFILKCLVCWKLKQQGIPFYTEAVFKDKSGRADVIADLGNNGIVYEIAVSEPSESLELKKTKYPEDLYVKVIRSKKDIENLI